MKIPWTSIKPGYYVLALLFLYSVLVTSAWQRSRAALQDIRLAQLEAVSDTPRAASAAAATSPTGTARVENGLWFPIAGARLPQNPTYLPGATRAYRQGVSQGFNFLSEDAGVPIPYGTPVIAAASGVVTRADTIYREREPEEWQALLSAVSGGTTDEQLDQLRGRQLEITTDSGMVLRYAHLAGIRPGISEGQRVYRGQVIGYVGNTGTTEGVRGTTQGARLHFEVWLPDGSFLGQDMDEETLRLRAASLFVGP